MIRDYVVSFVKSQTCKMSRQLVQGRVERAFRRFPAPRVE